MSQRATGTFEVKLVPQAPEGDGPGRLLIQKTFKGELEAVSAGQMLAHRSATAGSAGYVAMEKVSGALHGRAGTFLLQHSGTMNRGVSQLEVRVVPDSGTGALAGLAGKMEIVIDSSKHSYVFDYSLTEG